MEEFMQLKSSLDLQMEELKRVLEATIKEKDDAIKQVEEFHQTKGGVVNYTEFSLSEIKAATNNFDNSHVIGKGGFATVYKGFLRHTTVAIKILDPKKYQGNIEKEFNHEVEILTKVRHPNLVLLIGSSLEAWALIYEFLPNSLDAYLPNGTQPRRKLSWQNRIRIASEICSALIFLHSVGRHGIAHGDLKPQNILLDSSSVSKIIDFGISRELHKTDKTIPFHPTELPKFTRGYVDPEFISSYELTPQCDVYSYGIILLQLVTGRGPQRIRNYVEDIIENNKLDKLVDSLAGNWPIEEAKKLASLGLGCTEQSAKRRPQLVSEVWIKIESLQLKNSVEEKAKPEFHVPEFNKLLEEKNKLEHQLTESNNLLKRAREKIEELNIKMDAEEKAKEGHDVTNFSREELAAATNNFNESLKIGEGPYSIVYKGFLRHTTVAIKVFAKEIFSEKMPPESEASKLFDKFFNHEVQTLGKSNHPNIVLFIGASPDTRATVHDYLPNGSLKTYLLNGNNTKKLLWQDRIRIASEICAALIFLHSRCITHGNLKPQNVLLDSNFVSKLSGFNLSCNLANEVDMERNQRGETREPNWYFPYYPSPMSGYYGGADLTPQSDVFAFGIILLQLVTGMNAYRLRSNVEQAVENKKLDKYLDSSAGKWPIEEAMNMAELGLKCSQKLEIDRPNLTNDVWKTLEDMKQRVMPRDTSKRY